MPKCIVISGDIDFEGVFEYDTENELQAFINGVTTGAWFADKKSEIHCLTREHYTSYLHPKLQELIKKHCID